MKARSLSFVCSLVATGVPGLVLGLTLLSRRLPPSAEHVEAPPAKVPVAGPESAALTALRKFYAAPDSTAEVRIRAASSLSMLRGNDMPRVCRQAHSLPQAEREAVLKSLLGRWAEEDGPSAMLWGRDNLRGKAEWMQCFLHLGSVWASCDPAGFVEWFSSHRHEPWAPVGQGFASTVLSWLAPADVVAAARLACEEAGHTSDFISNTLRFHIHTKEQAEAIATLLKELPFPISKRQESGGRVHFSQNSGRGFAVAQVAKALESRWPEIDAEGWAAWVRDHPVGAGGRPHAAESALNAFVAAPTAAGATAAVQAAPPDLLADTTARIIDRWARLDVNAAGLWLSQQGFTEATAPAIESFAQAAVQIDPAAAFAWLEAVPDPARRERMILEQFDSWHQSDPVEASAFLNAATWPERRLQSIRRMAASRPQGRQ